jgi:integrase/recombinase XerD
MATVKIILRTSKINSAGEAPLCIRIIKDRNAKFVFLNYRIRPECWDESKGKVRKSHPNYQQLNAFLAGKVKEAESIALQMETADKKILPELIKEKIMGKAPVSFFKYADKYTDELKTNNKYGSRRKTKSVIAKMKKYTDGRELFFEHITVGWLKDYAHYLKTEHENKTNTVSCNFRTIRRIINLAISEDLIEADKNPFKKFRLVTEKVKKEFLTDNELMLLEVEQLEKDSLINLHRNMYVFSAYAGGLRISDVLLLKWRNYDGERILMQTKKTASIVTIKLPSKAQEILSLYQREDAKPDDFIFPKFSNDVDYSDGKRLFYAIQNADMEINHDLKAIAKKVGLEKKVTFHSARHTFATRALRKGIRIEYVSKLLGHASVSTTQIYAQVVNEELDKAMQVFN